MSFAPRGYRPAGAAPRLKPTAPVARSWLQRRPEQRALSKLLAAREIQAKLRVGASNDPLEHEADRIADQVLRTPAGDVSVAAAPVQVSRKCAACAHEEESLQRSSQDDALEGTAAPEQVDEVLQSAGSPLDAGTRGFFESRFGHDLSAVRVHTDAKAAQSAAAVQARAYTAGSAIVFGSGQYSPGTDAGRRLLAHEITHTLQQGGAASLLQREPLVRPRPPRVNARLMGAASLDGFALNGATLTQDHQSRLRILAHTLKSLLADYPGGVVFITGHTDATGGGQLNEQLGQQRAAAVAGYLFEQGVPAAALVSSSAGETQLRVATQVQEPRNRRVEVRFDPSAPKLESGGTDAEQGGGENLDASQICKTRPDLCEGRPPAGTPSSTLIPPRCPITGNCSAVATLSFGRQPPEFQKLLNDSFEHAEHWFATLDPERRLALVAIYNRFCALGLACHLRRIESVIPGEAPLSIGGVRIRVPGLSVSVNFVAHDNRALFDALTVSGISCRDAGIGGSLHPGQASLRQRTPQHGLHTSIGADDRSDAHLDIYSSPAVNGRGMDCTYDVPATIAHLGREVGTEKVRGFANAAARAPGIRLLPVIPYVLETVGAGVQGFPDFTLTPTVPQLEPPRADAAPPPILGITWAGPDKQPRQPLVPPGQKLPTQDLGRLTDQTIEKVRQAVAAQVRSDALVPPQLRSRLNRARLRAEQAGPDEEAALRAARDRLEQQVDFVDAREVALELAVNMARARLQQQSSVALDLQRYGRYDGLDGADRAGLYKQIQRIARIVRAAIPDSAAGITSVVVIFSTGGPVQIQLPP